MRILGNCIVVAEAILEVGHIYASNRSGGTDVKSGSSLSQVKLAVKSLDNKDIRVFAVAIGNEVDSTELSTATGSSKNIINSSKTDEPGKVREEIMTKIRQGKRSEMLLF